MFWIGLAVGLFLGVPVGIVVIALCRVSAAADQHIEEQEQKNGN